jgi:Flp pilus assembly protein TadD
MARLAESLALAVKQAQSRRDVATLSEVRNYYVQGTALLQQRRFAEAETHLRQALQLKPDDADVLNNLGTAIWEQGRSPEATAYYLRAYQFKKHDFGILNNLGMLLWDQGRPERAVEYYRQALELNPDSFDTRMNLGVSLSDIGRFDDALVWLRSATRMRPSSADAWDNVGMTFARQGHWDQAMKCYDEAIRLRPDFGEARRNRGLGWLTLGDFERGFPEAEWRFKCRNPPGLNFPGPRWAGEPLEGRAIVLHYEQGLGDTLQFIRFAPQVKERGGQVWLFCQPPLLRLMSMSPGVDLVMDGSSPIPDFQLQAPLMSVPSIIGTTAATLPRDPYLSVDAKAIERWRPALTQALGVAELNSVFKIGIAWQGNPTNRVDRWRSFPLAWFAQLASLPGVRLVSLQKGSGVEQLAALAGRFPVTNLERTFDGVDDKRDFLDTAAVMKLVDLVITPETAVAHLAGGLGVRTWVALSTVGDWRWMDRGDSCPWYPSARLFRQTTLGDWAGVFRQMADALGNELAQSRLSRPAS